MTKEKIHELFAKAVSKNALKIAKKLIEEYDIDPSYNKNAALFWAHYNRNKEAIEYLLTFPSVVDSYCTSNDIIPSKYNARKLLDTHKEQKIESWPPLRTLRLRMSRQ